ncbi:actin-domain-containing protein [Mrakia frigida]|uniref:actin-domain-containing protein n=1 Tax=Mrakia frigida TaxID=29902 RepID=UPI003FCC1F75
MASTPLTTPSRPTTSSSSSSTRPHAAPSPAYVTKDHKRHSLYGTEDRVVLDPGSSVWKVGFSGEPKPRAVFWAGDGEGERPIWEEEFEGVVREELDGLDWDHQGQGEGGEGNWRREMGEEIVQRRIGDRLREVFAKHLMTDPKSRKVIVLENPLLPTRIKEMLARCLFEDLQVPSISFIPPHLLALLAIGRTTGLVVDVGYLETVVLPIHLSRPLYTHLLSTPLASRHLHSTLHLLLLHFARYYPPVASLSAAASSTSSSLGPGERVEEEILARKGVLERVLSSGCFVGQLLSQEEEEDALMLGGDESFGGEEMDIDDPAPSSATSSSFVKKPRPPLPSHLLALKKKFSKRSTARPLRVPIPSLPGDGLGNGTLIVPGWIRERVAEDLFSFRKAGEGRDDEREEMSVVEVVLGVLMKLPIDLRTPLSSTILLTGGTSSLPGFLPRLRSSLLLALQPLPPPTTPSTPPSTPTLHQRTPRASRTPLHPYSSLLPLSTSLSLLNDPCPPGSAPPNAGSAPAFAPSLLGWIGGSLAGAMRVGSEKEVTREAWDEAREGRMKSARARARGRREEEGGGGGAAERAALEEQMGRKGGLEVLGDWSCPTAVVGGGGGRR